jgi:hypothetical protein
MPATRDWLTSGPDIRLQRIFFCSRRGKMSRASYAEARGLTVDDDRDAALFIQALTRAPVFTMAVLIGIFAAIGVAALTIDRGTGVTALAMAVVLGVIIGGGAWAQTALNRKCRP